MSQYNQSHIEEFIDLYEKVHKKELDPYDDKIMRLLQLFLKKKKTQNESINSTKDNRNKNNNVMS
jgi:hypothetical protein